jgi:transcriptional regulator with XRE-family HTH domain
MSTRLTNENLLGAYLRERRSKLDPAALGFTTTRRRTRGLRREEVAQRASISPTWYTWLEQGRGGAPSTDVLERLASALMLTAIEREHLFLLAVGHPPEVRYKKDEGVTPRLQRVLDALEPTPALIRTATWDVVAWNRGANLMLADYSAMPPEQRNILRVVFLDPRARALQYDWESVARFVVGSFRADAARAGAANEVEPLIAELSRASPEFRAMWADNDIRSHGEVVKRLRHPVLGPIEFEYSVFAVDGRPDLSMLTYNPVAPGDLERIQKLIDEREDGAANAEGA